MTMTLPSNLKESYVSGWYVFRFVQYNTTVNTTNLQISVSVCDKLLDNHWSSSCDSDCRIG